MQAPKDIDDLEERLSLPTEEVIETLRAFPGDWLVLGVAGKMGPSMARMIHRGLQKLGRTDRVYGVARFSQPHAKAQLEHWGIQTIPSDLLQEGALEKLPSAPHVVYLAGMKFGSTGQEPLTWAMNTWLPAMVGARFRSSRIVALSTGNVYGLSPVDQGGSRETDPLNPVGEYAMSCLGRERLLAYCSQTWNVPLALIRLNYACDLRYGVMVDLADKVTQGIPIDLSMGYFNTLWQGDANALTIATLKHTCTDPYLLNLTGPELLSVRETSHALGKAFNVAPHFQGSEASSALLSDARKCLEQIGRPRMDATTLLDWVVAWRKQGGARLGKPTHFESRQGKF
ncbi:MAG: NAD-dependent epimerase/dehydratase family protein [Pirellulales bacterium]